MSRKEARSQKPEARIGTRQEQKRVVRSPIPILASGFWLLASLCIFAQEHVGQYSQVDVETGFNLYNAIPGVNLRSGQFRRASTDSDLNRILQTGIPGTAMPPGRFNTAELAGLVAYIRAMRDFDTRPSRGDAGRGQAIFEGKGGCTRCHRVNGKGSRLAPDLTDIGAVRSPDALERSLLDPTSGMLPVNRSVRAVTRDGKVITGRRLNEDTYTVQLIDPTERLVSLSKSDLREYTVVKTSPMPSYKNELSSGELDDVVAYLRTLKGSK